MRTTAVSARHGAGNNLVLEFGGHLIEPADEALGALHQLTTFLQETVDRRRAVLQRRRERKQVFWAALHERGPPQANCAYAR